MREHQELVFISQNGMVQRTSVRGINRYGRASQGVRVMNIRDDDQVSAVALVVESDSPEVADVDGDDARRLEASSGEIAAGRRHGRRRSRSSDGRRRGRRSSSTDEDAGLGPRRR